MKNEQAGMRMRNAVMKHIVSVHYVELKDAIIKRRLDMLIYLSNKYDINKKLLYNYCYHLIEADPFTRIRILSLNYYGIPRTKFIEMLQHSWDEYCLCKYNHLSFKDDFCYFCAMKNIRKTVSPDLFDDEEDNPFLY